MTLTPSTPSFTASTLPRNTIRSPKISMRSPKDNCHVPAIRIPLMKIPLVPVSSTTYRFPSFRIIPCSLDTKFKKSYRISQSLSLPILIVLISLMSYFLYTTKEAFTSLTIILMICPSGRVSIKRSPFLSGCPEYSSCNAA